MCLTSCQTLGYQQKLQIAYQSESGFQGAGIWHIANSFMCQVTPKYLLDKCSTRKGTIEGTAVLQGWLSDMGGLMVPPLSQKVANFH